MRKVIEFLGSVKLSVIVLVALVVALAGATVVESMKGTPAAWAAVYGALWFRGLLALFALNVALSMVNRWPWGWERAGFALTHGAMLVILAGALVTDLTKTEGHLALFEGEESALVTRDSGPTAPAEEHAPGFSLPFSVKLDAFEIDTYPGTHRPAMFRSRVTVNDTATGRRFPAVIQMNHELSYAGWRLFQSSYQIDGARRQTVLSASHDPGQPIVFVGYALLVAGMCAVFGTRVAQRRALLRRMTETAPPPRARGRALVASLACAVAALAGSSRAATPADAATAGRLRALPVQHDGRVMPLDTLAREAVWNVTGERRWQGTDPVALALGWVYHADEWAHDPLIRIGSAALAAEIGLPGQTHAAFHDLVSNPRLRALAEQAHQAEEADRPVGGLLKKVNTLEERLVAFDGLASGTALRVVPDPRDPNAEWGPADPARGPDALTGLLASRPAGYPSEGAIRREITYNAMQPTRLSWWILLAALVASVAAWVRPGRVLDGLAFAGLAGGFATMTWGIATRWQVAGRIPAANMYESMLFLGWGVGLFALIALIVLRNRLVILNATAMSALAMLLADRLPIDGFIHPVPPVLSGTPWLAIHVPIIMVSYSVLALGVLIAHMQIGCTIFAPARKDLAIRMNDLLYWYTHVGAILLITGIMTGSIWAASSWGRYWGWDPKEVWSLVAFLAYLAILHGRFDRLIGPFGVAALSIIAFWMIVMTYVGVNFVLASGLHSYGFGSSSVALWLLIVAGAETLYLTLGLYAHISRPGAFQPSA